MATIQPCLSQTKWILVVKPPRDRPSAWSRGSCICVCLRPPSRREPPGLELDRFLFFSPSSGSPTCPDDGTVDTPQVVVDLLLVIQFVEQRGDDANPCAIPAPVVEPGENGLPRSVALREITPGSAGVKGPKNTVDDRSVVLRWSSRLTASGP